MLMNPKTPAHTAQNRRCVTYGHSGAVWPTIALSTMPRVRFVTWNSATDETMMMKNCHLSVRF